MFQIFKDCRFKTIVAFFFSVMNGLPFVVRKTGKSSHLLQFVVIFLTTSLRNLISQMFGQCPFRISAIVLILFPSKCCHCYLSPITSVLAWKFCWVPRLTQSDSKINIFARYKGTSPLSLTSKLSNFDFHLTKE